MSSVELVIRVISKLLMIIGIIAIIIGSFALESNIGFALKFIVPGACIALPDILIWFIDGLNLKEEN